MRRNLLTAGLVSLLVGITVAQDAPEKPAPADKVVPVALLSGTIKSAGDTARELTLKVAVRTLEPNVEAQADYLRRQQQLLLRQRQILANPNPVQRIQQLEQLQRDAQNLLRSRANLFRVKTTDRDITLPLAADLQIRSIYPAQEFDNKGNIKVYTPAELKALRGTSGLPGYEAGPEMLESGRLAAIQIVRRTQPGMEKEKEPASMEGKDRLPPGLEISVVIVGVVPSK